MFSRIPELCPLDAGSIFPIPTNCKNQTYLPLDIALVENH